MNEYRIKYLSKCASPIIIITGVALGLLGIPFLYGVYYLITEFSNNYTFELLIGGVVICVALMGFIGFKVSKNYIKKYEKEVYIILDNEYANINNGEIYIYYDKIFGLNLSETNFFSPALRQTVKYSDVLTVLYNTENRLNLEVIVDDKKNTETLIKFYNELKQKYEGAKNDMPNPQFA